MKDGLTIKIGPHVNDEGGFRILVGDLDITDDMMVRSIRLHASPESGPTKVTLECYASAVEIIPSAIDVKIIDK